MHKNKKLKQCPVISVSLEKEEEKEATRSRIQGQCVAWYARLLPNLRRCSLTDPVGMAR